MTRHRIKSIVCCEMAFKGAGTSTDSGIGVKPQPNIVETVVGGGYSKTFIFIWNSMHPIDLWQEYCSRVKRSVACIERR